MTTFLVILGVLGAGLAAFWYFGAKPARHGNTTPERLTTLVGMLLERGQNGSALFVEERHGQRFVQLTKYAGDSNRWGIQCDFPLAPWSEQLYARVPECVAKLGLRAREMKTGRSDTKGFLTIDFRRDVKQATALIACIVEQVFGLDLVRDCEAYLVRLPAKRLDVPAQGPHSAESRD